MMRTDGTLEDEFGDVARRFMALEKRIARLEKENREMTEKKTQHQERMLGSMFGYFRFPAFCLPRWKRKIDQRLQELGLAPRK